MEGILPNATPRHRSLEVLHGLLASFAFVWSDLAQVLHGLLASFASVWSVARRPRETLREQDNASCVRKWIGMNTICMSN